MLCDLGDTIAANDNDDDEDDDVNDDYDGGRVDVFSGVTSAAIEHDGNDNGNVDELLYSVLHQN